MAQKKWPWLAAGLVLLVAAFLLLWGLNMRRGLNHDEHQFVASGALLARAGLLPYRDFAYFHVPVLSLVYALLFQFTPYLLLAARAFNIACSALLLALLLLVALAPALASVQAPARRPSASAAPPAPPPATAPPGGLSLPARFLAGLSAVILLLSSPSFVHASGRAWNHDLPVLLTSLAACLFGWWLHASVAPVPGAQTSPSAPPVPPSPSSLPSPWLLLPAGLLLGLAAGTRASFAFVAPAFALALLWCAGWRNRRTFLALGSLALGGLIGLIPTLALFALAPERFIFGNLTYAGLNTAYYAQLPAPPPAMTLIGKLLATAQLVAWQPGNLLLVLLAGAALWQARRSLRPATAPELVFALLLLPCLLAGAFAPTPLQEQYIYPLFPWCAFVFLAALRYAPSPRPLLIGAGIAAALAALLAAPRYSEGAAVALQPGEWFPLKVHARSERLVQLAGGERVLTLAPIFVLEGGGEVYPQLVSGPLGFRVASLLDAEERTRMGLLGPDELAALLAAEPPRALFTGVHDSDAAEEAPLVAFAQESGYVPVPEEEPALLWSRPLATWGDAIHLGAVDLPLRPVPPGGDLLLTFYLQAVQPLARNWNVLLRLVAPDGVTDLARSEGWPWGRPTLDWQPGEVWPDGHTLAIAQDAAPGPYRVEMSFYDAGTLELLGDGPATAGFVVVDGVAGDLGVADIGAAGPSAAPLARFGGCIDLLAAAVPAEGWVSGATQPVQLTWQRTAPDCGRYTMFVHLAGPQGLASQRDQEPLGGFYPTDAWLLHAPVADRYDLALPPDLPPGEYQVLVGLYDSASGQRLPLLQDGAPVGDAYLAATVQVTAQE